MPAANLGALAIAGARFSEFLEESKAATTSTVERTMVEIDNHIEAPVFSGPLPPGEGGSLAGETVQNLGWPDELVRFFPEPSV